MAYKSGHRFRNLFAGELNLIRGDDFGAGRNKLAIFTRNSKAFEYRLPFGKSKSIADMAPLHDSCRFLNGELQESWRQLTKQTSASIFAQNPTSDC